MIGHAALRPWVVDNLLVTSFPGGGARFYAGSSVVLRWSFRVKDGAGNAANEVVAGAPTVVAVPPSEGDFLIRVFSVGLEFKRLAVIPAAAIGEGPFREWTYFAGDRTADFGGEPSRFVVRASCRNGMWEGTERILLVTRV